MTDKGLCLKVRKKVYLKILRGLKMVPCFFKSIELQGPSPALLPGKKSSSGTLANLIDVESSS